MLEEISKYLSVIHNPRQCQSLRSGVHGSSACSGRLVLSEEIARSGAESPTGSLFEGQVQQQQPDGRVIEHWVLDMGEERVGLLIIKLVQAMHAPQKHGIPHVEETVRRHPLSNRG